MIGMGTMRFLILEIGKAGLIKVQSIDDGTPVGMKRDSMWWINLNQALLVEAIK